MKKIIYLMLMCFSISFVSCKQENLVSEIVSEAGAPFKEYKMKYNKEIEEAILKKEVDKYGLDQNITTANVIKLTKIGKYVCGTVRIIGSIKKTSEIVTYDCEFEKSYSNKNGNFVFRSGFPQQ